MADAGVATEPQTSFDEEQLDDDALLVALNEWAATDAEVDKAKEAAAPGKQAVDVAKEARDEAAGAVNSRLKQLEKHVVGTENVYRCGTFRLGNKHKPEGHRDFDIPEKDTLTIERAE